MLGAFGVCDRERDGSTNRSIGIREAQRLKLGNGEVQLERIGTGIRYVASSELPLRTIFCMRLAKDWWDRTYRGTYMTPRARWIIEAQIINSKSQSFANTCGQPELDVAPIFEIVVGALPGGTQRLAEACQLVIIESLRLLSRRLRF